MAFFVFLTAALAETKRIPFDMPEGESEIIGYFVEYSGMKFGMFYLADFLETIVVACLVDHAVPRRLAGAVSHAGRLPLSLGCGAAASRQWTYVLLGVGSFSIKVLVFCWLFMQIRWTLPRFRYDQLMALGWKGLFPIAVANVLVTAAGAGIFRREILMARQGPPAARADVLGKAVRSADPQRPQDHLRTLLPEPVSSHGAQRGTAQAPCGVGDLPVSRGAQAARARGSGAATG